jgi:hypothetical protein
MHQRPKRETRSEQEHDNGSQYQRKQTLQYGHSTAAALRETQSTLESNKRHAGTRQYLRRSPSTRTPPWVAGHVPGYTIMLRHFLPDTRYPMATATKRRAKPVLSSLVSAAAVRGAISSGSFATATMSGYAPDDKKHVGIRAAHEEHQQAYLTSLLVRLHISAC